MIKDLLREKLTCVIGTKNAEHDIGDCIRAVVGIADEIIVIDDFSTDNTVEIAKGLASHVFQKKMLGYPEQMHAAINTARNRWILILDADERVTPEFAAEVSGILSEPKRMSGYLVRRLNHFLGREIRHCGWYERNNLRLFDKELVRYDLSLKYLVQMRISGSLGEIEADLIHHTCRDLYGYFKRMNLWSALNADDLIMKGFRINFFNGFFYFLVKPIGIFFWKYFWLLGWRDRLVGFLICAMSAITYFLSCAKLWLRQNMDPDARLNIKRNAWHNDPPLPGDIHYVEKRFH